MSDERTPLITTVRVGPPRRRYPHNVLRRFCTIALSSTLIWFFLAFTVTMIFGNPNRRHSHHNHDNWSWPGWHGRKVTYEQLKEILTETPDNKKAAEWSQYYTSGAHLAGQNYSQVLWTKQKWEEWGIKSHIVAYDTYLNRPIDHRLALLEKKGKDASSWKVAFEASLTEDVLKDDPTTGFENSVPTFHGYSGSGNATGPLVYVNYGTYQDYEDLVNANISFKGKVVIARYGAIFRGLKVKRAQDLGAVGVILYSDPGDDGDVTEENGLEIYPNGPARHPSSVQRGSTQFLSFRPGDPTTPGYPSKPGVPRADPDTIPSIPSIPVSYNDALPLLKALNGHGPNVKELNKYWNRDLGLRYKGVKYNVGPTPDDVVVNIVNQQDYITTPIWNVIGVINGTIPDEVIVVGNHRDAWIVGGAADPNSGSASINEAIRSIGKAVEAGWKPLRTIVFASWDGEEYGLVGSTEWVEEYLPWISFANAAYINIDNGASGTEFRASASPLLNQLVTDVVATVQSPNQTVKGQTVGDLWDGHVGNLGSGSDYTGFLDFAGVASLDFSFTGAAGGPVYHYHSNYDSFHWMSNFGDPDFLYHQTAAKIIGLLVAKLADEPVLSFGAKDYAYALGEYVGRIEKKLDEAEAGLAGTASYDIDNMTDDEIVERRGRRHDANKVHTEAELAAAGLHAKDLRKGLGRLRGSVWEFTKKALELDAKAKILAQQAAEHLPWWKWPAKIHLGFQIRKVNTKYKYLERAFLFQDGLDGRSWFKHVVFAPGLWTGYAGAVFPGLVESIDDENWSNALRWVDIIDSSLKKATDSI